MLTEITECFTNPLVSLIQPDVISLLWSTTAVISNADELKKIHSRCGNLKKVFLVGPIYVESTSKSRY